VLSVGIPEATPGRNATVIADQWVEADGSISVPYAGRIPAAGRTAEEVQKTIEARLAEKALQPQALVIVQKTAANAVTVLLSEAGGVPAASAAGGTAPAGPVPAASPTGPGPVPTASAAGAAPGQTASVAGARVPLSLGGDRLLQVIAAAGG